MLFNSTQFVAFFLVVYAGYLVLAHRPQNWWLLVASYVFYSSWDWRFSLLMLLSTSFNYVYGQRIFVSESLTRKRWMVSGVAANLGVLFVFKYFNFFAENGAALLHKIGLGLSTPMLSLVLPLGISFYTFHNISYLVDVHQRRIEPARRWSDYALYVALFPQLIAGPIARPSHLLPQIERPRHISYEMVREGFWLILLGYFKKVVLADNMLPFSQKLFLEFNHLSGWEVLLAIYAFAFQIYGDFSGYSDIARGLSKLMGFELLLNFERPYLATNPSDFWRRWHISLSTWLRDYLYIPLGGNRHGELNTYRNLFITMLLGGLWHGAAWHFMAWGAFHGTLLMAYHAWSKAREQGQFAWWPSKYFENRLGRALSVLAFFQVTCLGWLIFGVQGVPDIPSILRQLLVGGSSDGKVLWTLVFFAGPLMLMEWLEERAGRTPVVRCWPRPVRLVCYAFVVATLMLCSALERHSFIYFQF
jgi:D-alanyl-lipoteichoic acid acyltransferase DltB (MBOAT superfamily)